MTSKGDTMGPIFQQISIDTFVPMEICYKSNSAWLTHGAGCFSRVRQAYPYIQYRGIPICPYIKGI